MKKPKRRASWIDYAIATLMVFAVVMSVINATDKSFTKYDLESYKKHKASVECFESIESFTAFVKGEPSPC